MYLQTDYTGNRYSAICTGNEVLSSNKDVVLGDLYSQRSKLYLGCTNKELELGMHNIYIYISNYIHTAIFTILCIG